MKQEIDRFIELNYTKLLNIAKSKIERFDRSYTPEELVSEAYIYVVKNQPKNVEDIPRYMVNFMNIEIVGQNSNTNRALSVNSKEVLIESSYEIIYDLELRDEIEAFEKKLDRLNQILWEVYYKKGHTKIKEIAAHFDISMSQAYIIRKELLKKLIEHYEDQKRI